MRFSTTFAAAAAIAAIFVSAASTPSKRQGGFPNCSVNCLTNATAFGSCSPTDDVCLCNNAGFISATHQCFTSSCSGSDAALADTQSAQLCKAAGVTVTSAPGAIIIIGSSTQTIPTGSATVSAATATTTGAAGGTTTSATATTPVVGPVVSPSATTSKSSANTLTVGSTPVLAVAAAALAAFAL
ncbi:hypothetical protein FRB94_008523 [Tulasnella sp. JGI-2019a]|nr:hypothetical protein FRB94_008523 [Tulasnella sp. JGI-2019a]KAG8999374.1 hypothetical protein FRB93_013253 [Tulasnella sp. JGI-2019a]KAG9027185.1 hypothetical protein FRB95_008021 [Tulasnella sp. JGI-2019a]